MATKHDFIVKNGLRVRKSLTVDSDVTIAGALNVAGNVTGSYAGFDSDFNVALDSAALNGTGLSYNSTTNTLSIADTGVDSATYGSASLVPVLKINAQGQIDSAGTVSVAGVSSTAFDSASHTLTINTADGGSFDQIVQTKMPGTSGSFGSAALVPVITVNQYGLVDSINEVSVAGVSTFDFDSATGQLTIGTADGGSFSQVLTLDPFTASDVNFATLQTTGNLTIGGNLQVNGTTTTVSSQNLQIEDNMFYLNQLESAGSPTLAVDVGFAANVNDAGSYAHTGFFRDASDATWKLFDNYTPEPDSDLDIDINHASFDYAPLQIAGLTTSGVTSTGDVGVTGNITVSGTVDGRDVAADGAKLDGIASGATADQTASEILTAIKTVDGTGSGLDADTVDGLQGSQFLRSDASDTSSGTIAFGTGSLDPDSYTGYSGGFGTIADGSGWSARGVFINAGGAGKSAAIATAGGQIYFGTQDGANNNSMATWMQVAQSSKVADFKANPTVNSNAIWHAGNDGSGSGLDADTVDGIHASKIVYDKGNQIGTTSSWDITTPGMYGVTSGSAFTGTNNPSSAISGIYTYGVLTVFEVDGQGIGQLYTPHTGNKIALRTGWNNGGWYPWQQVWTSTSDGSGSGLDADTVDGIQASSFLRSDASDSFSANYTSNSGNWIKFAHSNQSDANDGKIGSGVFGSGLNIVGTQTSGGTGRQVRIWGNVITSGGETFWHAGNATGAGYVDVATGNYGTIKVDDDRSVTWAGYAIRDDWVLMSDGASNCGIYNDTDNEWSVLCRQNAEVELYYNGSVQAETQNGFFLANSQMRAPIYYESSNTAYYFDGANTGDSIRVAGDIVAYYSDERLKDFQGRINGALDKVLKINGYYYTENEKAKELGYNTGKTQVGVSAQEVEAVLPEIIKDAPIGHGYKTVQYERLVPLLIEAIKEQNDKIDRLEAMVEKLINTNKG